MVLTALRLQHYDCNITKPCALQRVPRPPLERPRAPLGAPRGPLHARNLPRICAKYVQILGKSTPKTYGPFQKPWVPGLSNGWAAGGLKSSFAVKRRGTKKRPRFFSFCADVWSPLKNQSGLLLMFGSFWAQNRSKKVPWALLGTLGEVLGAAI